MILRWSCAERPEEGLRCYKTHNNKIKQNTCSIHRVFLHHENLWKGRVVPRPFRAEVRVAAIYCGVAVVVFLTTGLGLGGVSGVLADRPAPLSAEALVARLITSVVAFDGAVDTV